MLIAGALSLGSIRIAGGALAVAAATLAAILAEVASARASENYPAIIDRQKGVECPRPLTRCLICHDTAAGGEETANRPFAKALVDEYGLSGGKAGRELAMAIAQLPDDVDTDGDGVPDQEELALCMNPSGGELSEGPGFGCNLRPNDGGDDATSWLASLMPMPMLMLMLMALLSRRRRQQRAGLHPLSRSPAGASLLLVACTPTPISEERFQSRAQTCYEFPVPGDAGQGGFGSGLERRDGCGAAPSLSGNTGPSMTAGSAGEPMNGGAVPSGAAGAVPSGAAGAVPSGAAGAVPSGAAGAVPAMMLDPVAPADAGASPGSAGRGGGSSPSPLPPGCSEQAILEQFSRPYDVGGCTDPGGTGCHEDGTGEAPILQYPDQTVARLLDQRDADGCREVWIPSGLARPEDSFFWRRLNQNVSDDDCEIQMPLDEDPLDEQTLACVSAWIVWVSNGRRE